MRQKSKTKFAKTILPVRCTVEFTRLCQQWSNIEFPISDRDVGPKISAARFLKGLAIRFFISNGIKKEYLDSIT